MNTDCIASFIYSTKPGKTKIRYAIRSQKVILLGVNGRSDWREQGL